MKESNLAHLYLDGLKGIEIGGASHNSFGLCTQNVDIAKDSLSARRSIEHGFKPMHVDFIASGDKLPFDDNSYDFVISSHVIEHFHNPIKTLLEWKRVARKYIFIICPHKARTFDRDKVETPIKELLNRFNNPIKQEEFSHQAYYTAESFIIMCNTINNMFGGFKIAEVQDPDDKVGNGFTVVVNLEVN